MPSKEKVAVKILEKEKIQDESDIERITREIQILKLIRHPNIVQLYEVRKFKKDHRRPNSSLSDHRVCVWRRAL